MFNHYIVIQALLKSYVQELVKSHSRAIVQASYTIMLKSYLQFGAWAARRSPPAPARAASPASNHHHGLIVLLALVLI